MDCEVHQKSDGRWGCRRCDESWDEKPTECRLARQIKHHPGPWAEDEGSNIAA